MSFSFRSAFPYIVLIVLIGAVVWAFSMKPLPPADFTFDNGTEVQTLDPAKATGNPENRMINGLFEGLLRQLPEPGYREKYGLHENAPLTAQPATAESHTVSEDGKTYTFIIRKDAKWSDGSPVTAHDFEFSWQRMLHPETASQYTYQLFYVKGTENFSLAKVKEGDEVEVELNQRRSRYQTYPRGPIERGVLTKILKKPEPKYPKGISADDKSKLETDWKKSWTYVVDLGNGEQRAYSKEPAGAVKFQNEPPTECLHVLTDWDKTVGITAKDDRTLIVELNNRTPFFPELVAFYPLYPVNRKCVEEHGSPQFTQPGKLVSNGPFNLELRQLRDRIRLKKSETYWDASNVKLKSIDALALRDETTALNMYLTGQIDWATTMPAAMIPQLKVKLKDEFPSAAMLTVYFYRLNTTRPGLEDKRVRQALNLAINKAEICTFVTKAGEVPAGTYVPPGMAGYESPPGVEFNPQRAKDLLAEAGYPGGRGFPHMEILYNDAPVLHRTIAETIQQSWRKHLGIDVQLAGLEWGVYLDAQDKLDYYIARAGWIADYPDPNTFLDMFKTGGLQNMTGWGNPKYDELIEAAGREPNAAERMKILKQAEVIFLDETPIIPMYFYVSKNLVKPHVKGFCNDVQDLHPFSILEIDRSSALGSAKERK
jgi:oligopeptide transport system substrate-binding protein